MEEHTDLDLRFQLTEKYILSGGIRKAEDIDLLRDLLKVQRDANGKIIPHTITPRLNEFMSNVLGPEL